MSVYIKNIGNPLRITCGNGVKIKLNKGLTKISDTDLETLKNSKYFNSFIDSEILKIDAPKPNKIEKVKGKKGTIKKVDDNDDNDD